VKEEAVVVPALDVMKLLELISAELLFASNLEFIGNE